MDGLTASKHSATARASPSFRFIPRTPPHSTRRGPRELQSPGSFIAKGRITNFDLPPEYSEGDFYDFKKLNLAVDWGAKYPTPSPTLQHLILCYEYWIAYADLDGFRIDAVK